MFSQNQSARQVGRFSVCVLFSVYLGEWYVYHFICKPEVVAAVLFNIAYVMAIASYLRAACTDPGTPESPEWLSWSRDFGPVNPLRVESRKRGWAPGETTKCEVCLKLRPERAHHCNLCGVCILRMDHHCPWIGNCVGWRNHKYFVLLTWWSALACVLWLVTLRGPNAIEAMDAFSPSSHRCLIPLVFVIMTVLLLIVTGGMAMYSMSMAAKNITAIEELFHGDNPYRQASWWSNIEQLLGPIGLSIFVPLPAEERSNGSSFPVVGVDENRSRVKELVGCSPPVAGQAKYGSTGDGCGGAPCVAGAPQSRGPKKRAPEVPGMHCPGSRAPPSPRLAQANV